MFGLLPKPVVERFLRWKFVIRGYSSAEPTEEQQDLDADFSQIVSARGSTQQGGSNIKEPWVNKDVEAVEMLFVKIKYGALRGEALWPRGGGFFPVD